MSNSSVIWRADNGDLSKVSSLIDLLEQARDVLKQSPGASLTIVSDQDQKTINFSIVVDEQSYSMVVNRDIPNINAYQSLTLDC